jgi:hypothetical protein
MVVEYSHLRRAAVRNHLFACSAVHGHLRSSVRTPALDRRGTCVALSSSLAPGPEQQCSFVARVAQHHRIIWASASDSCTFDTFQILTSVTASTPLVGAPVEMHQGTICVAPMYQQSSFWCICITLMGHLHRSVRAYIHWRLRNWKAISGQHFCSLWATLHLREALTVIRAFAGTHSSIPYALFDSIKIPNTQRLTPEKSPMLEYKLTCTLSDTQDNLYSSSSQARFHVRYLARTQASTSTLILGSMRT